MGASNKSARLVASGASDNATAAINGPCRLDNITGYNTKASTVFLKVYQLASNLAAPTSGSTPFLTLALPATAAFAFDWPKGIQFNFGIGYRLVTGAADNDATAVGANDILGLNFLAG